MLPYEIGKRKLFRHYRPKGTGEENGKTCSWILLHMGVWQIDLRTSFAASFFVRLDVTDKALLPLKTGLTDRLKRYPSGVDSLAGQHGFHDIQVQLFVISFFNERLHLRFVKTS